METLNAKLDTDTTRHAEPIEPTDEIWLHAPGRTPTFSGFMNSLRTSPRKVIKLSLDYATRR